METCARWHSMTPPLSRVSARSRTVLAYVSAVVEERTMQAKQRSTALIRCACTRGLSHVIGLFGRQHALGDVAAPVVRLQEKAVQLGRYRDELAMLAEDAMKQTRLLVNNPRPVTEADALEIYRSAF